MASKFDILSKYGISNRQARYLINDLQRPLKNLSDNQLFRIAKQYGLSSALPKLTVERLQGLLEKGETYESIRSQYSNFLKEAKKSTTGDLTEEEVDDYFHNKELEELKDKVYKWTGFYMNFDPTQNDIEVLEQCLEALQHYITKDAISKEENGLTYAQAVPWATATDSYNVMVNIALQYS